MKVKYFNIAILNVFLLVTLSVSVYGSVYNTFYGQASPISAETPKVVLQSGTAGTSTIYTNNTSAKVSVAAPRNWWNLDYDYRKQMSIINNVASTLGSGYSVCLIVNTTSLVSSSKMLLSGNDLRVVYWSGSNSIELDREVINMNSDSTQVWFKTQATIEANGSDSNYYIYYGNPTAGSPPANRSNVYDFWDDFDDASLDPAWTFLQIGGASGSYSESGTVVILNATTSGDLWDTSDNFLFLSISRSYDVLIESYTPSWGGVHDTWSKMGGAQLRQSIDANSKNRIMSPVYSAVGATNSYRLSTGGSTFEQTTGTQPKYCRLSRIGGTSRAWYSTDGISWTELGSQISFSGGLSDPVRLGIHLAGLSSSSHWVEVDWFKVRKYVDPEPSTSVGLEERNIEDYVDNNTSDVDSSADKGIHSNFSAQQYGPDSSFDILREEDTLGSWGDYSSELLTNPGAEFGNTTGWTATGPNAANFAAGYDCPAGSAGPHTGSYAFYWNNPSSSSDWAYQEVDLSPWLLEIQSGDAQITAKGWLVCSEYHAPPWDIVRMRVVFYDNSSQEISSDTYDTGEQGDLQNWTEFGIENYTIPTNAVKVRMWSQTFENSWDAGNADDFSVKVRTYKRNYELDLEVQWTNATYDLPNEELCIFGGTMGSENIRVDVWNGTAWQNLFTDLTSGWNNISVSSYLTSLNFTIRFKGDTETGDTNQDSWNIDATILHVWTGEYDHVLKVVNQVANNWKVNLKVYDSSNIGRLSSLTISFHEGTTSDQIIISGGVITQSEGPQYDLPGNATRYISIVNLSAGTSGTSYLYVYLKILVPDTTTYSLYIITFEIT